MQSEQKQKHYTKAIIILLVILSAFAAITKIFIGVDVDEGYAVSMPYRLMQGDKLFLDMWEIHQTSSILPYLFIWVFVKITGGNTGIVLYLRIVSTVIHLAFSIWVYKELSSKISREWSALGAVLYFNFLPKWLMNLDFSMQLIWGMTAMLFLLNKKKMESQALFLAGISLAMTVLGYPSMAVLYPFALWIIWKYHDKSWKKMVVFTFGCGMCAVLFLGYIFSYMSPKELIESIPYVFSDGSHQFDMATKWGLFFKRWLEAAVQAAVLLVPTCTVLVLCKLIAKKRVVEKEHYYYLFLLAFMLFSSFIVIFANVVGISWGPFRLQVRYLVLFIMAFFLGKNRALDKGFRDSKKMRDYLLIGTLVAFAGILLASNVGPVSSSSYLVLGILGLVLFIYQYQKAVNIKHGEVISYLVVSVFILSLIFCKGYYVRVSEYPPANILEAREQVTFGPLKGIYVYEEDLRRAADFYEVIKDGEEERLLLLSTEGIYNLYSNGTYVIPTTISTPAFNEQWVEYFELHKDKMPTRIIIGKNTIDNLDKFFANNPLGIWIGENYSIESRKEDEYLCVIQK
ncbi:MAG: glycosyltransferase family 39 protein [Lachnospiraceae bacterium]|nr:glycosyltransferase family 39 protein [Lachnospiraceae bacterium]